MSKIPHEPTDTLRQLVQVHATVGTPQDTIARILDIDPKTLRKYYRDELDLSSAKANAKIGGALYNKAVGGDTQSQIFWMKTRAGWRETNRTELTGADGGPIETEDTGARDKLAAILTARIAAGGNSGGDS